MAVEASGSAGIDLLATESDMFEFPTHIKLDYNGVVHEPDYFGDNKVASCFKPISACLNTWYDTIHVATYYILSIIFGSVLSVLWGIVFGIVNFFTVWCVQPFIKLFFTSFRCGYMVSRAWVRMFCDPINESLALALSKIRGNFVLNVSGVQKV